MLQLEFNVINFDFFSLVEDLSEVQKHIMARFAFVAMPLSLISNKKIVLQSALDECFANLFLPMPPSNVRALQPPQNISVINSKEGPKLHFSEAKVHTIAFPNSVI